MLNQNQVSAIMDCVSSAILVLFRAHKPLDEIISLIESIKTQEGLLMQIEGENQALKTVLATLHSLYNGNYTKFNELGELEIHEFDIQAGHVPLNLHLINNDFTKEDLVELGTGMLSTCIETIAMRMAQERPYEPPLPPDDDEHNEANQNPTPQPWGDYILEEVCGGVADGVKGMIYPFIHPLQFIENTVEAIAHPIDTVSNIVEHAKQHPIRFSTSIATSYGIAKAASNMIDPKAPAGGSSSATKPVTGPEPLPPRAPAGSSLNTGQFDFNQAMGKAQSAQPKFQPLLRPQVSHYRPPGGGYGPVPGYDLPIMQSAPQSVPFTPARDLNLARQSAQNSLTAANTGNVLLNTADNRRRRELEEIHTLLKSSMIKKSNEHFTMKDINAALNRVKLRTV